MFHFCAEKIVWYLFITQFCKLIAAEDSIYFNENEPKIVGGHNANIQDMPYQAQILQRYNQICGATIISEYWLVSAAHCFDGRRGLIIRTGSKFRSQGDIHEIKKIVVPDTYNPRTLNNDISLIMLKTPIRFNMNQKAIRISQRHPQAGDEITISGFGKESEHGRAANILKAAQTVVVDQTLCARRHFPLAITNNMFCAGIGYTDACQGDSGSPAVLDNKLIGIVSWGRDCASHYYPGVYTKVYNYRKWITKVTGVKYRVLNFVRFE